MARNISRKVFIIFLFAALFFVLAGSGIYKKYFRGISPAIFAPPKDIAEYLPEDTVPSEAINETNFPLKLPDGFTISIFAKNLAGARVMRFDTFGNMWVSRTGKGAITLLEIDRGTGKVLHQDDIFNGLRKPHGLAFDPNNPFLLYIAEENRVRRITVYSDDSGEDVLSLPLGEGHFTRTIGFGPDNKLYISVGSSCNVCNEEIERRASIIQYDIQTKISKIFAKGLRNAIFFVWNGSTSSPQDGLTRLTANNGYKAQNEMWVTEMGRDWLGDNLPPDEINIIRDSSINSEQNSIPNFGWPICYGKNIHDTDFDKNTYIRNPCMEPFELPSFIDIPAHSAPLGLAFVSNGTHSIGSGQAWPEDYWYDLLVAYHGSWNRSDPIGYKVVRHKFDANGNYQGVEDFITGWLVQEGALGRPVDIIFNSKGEMFLSDDKAGVIYKIIYQSGKPRVGDKSNLIKVKTPLPGKIVKSPLVIEGEARGNWFFEASFPVRLVDGNSKEIFRGHAEALSEWMTTDFVPFRATLEFKMPDTASGELILEKDNPSGLPENYDELRIPIRFR